MAFIRSERNALDRLFAGEMPQGIQVVDEEYMAGGSIEGEVIKGGGKIGETAEEQGGEEKPGATILPPPGDKSQKIGVSAARDPSTIINFGDLFQALWDDFQLSKSESLKELNVNSQEDITELPSECYIRVKAAKG